MKIAMPSLQNVRILPNLRRFSSETLESSHISSKSNLYAISSFLIAQSHRFYRTKKTAKSDDDESLQELLKIPKVARKHAQAALLDYLHSTRSLPFMDAENMSKNSPRFLLKLIKGVGHEKDIGRSVARIFRYSPINEFEPFFESIGLKPCEYSAFLPKNLMFLNEDPVLLENFHVLCDYGFPRHKIGRIYMEATEVFRYDYGVLQSNLLSFEGLGLKQFRVVNIVASVPSLLVKNGNTEFFQLVETLKSVGIECDWIGGHLREGNSYSWSHMLELLSLLSKMGCSNLEQGHLISKHPDLLFYDSGRTAFSIIGFVLKFGARQSEIYAMFSEFPDMSVERFMLNLRHCYEFLVEIEMEVEDIGLIIRSYPKVLGSCRLKKASSLLTVLNVGKKRLCKLIKDDPHVLKKWVLGARVEALSNEEEARSQMMKTEFLLRLGFVKNSSEMETAFKLFRGKGLELQERFNCLVNAGLDPKDVLQMVKATPETLNQTKEVIEMKIDNLVNGCGYPISGFIKHPAFIKYTIQRVKLRLSMYNWLKDQARVDPDLSLSTLLACSEEIFVRTYVSKHPEGHEHWEKLKKEIYSA